MTVDATTPGLTVYDAADPALDEGVYTLTVTVDVAVAGTDQPASYTRSQTVSVGGPAAGLAPGDVVRTTPPAGGVGAYAGWVPTVVLGRATLPWEVAVDGAGTPWLALMVLDAAIVLDAGTNPDGSVVRSLDDVVTPPTGYVVPTPSAAMAAASAVTPTPQVTTIDVAVGDALAALPAVPAIGLLAHVRQMTTADPVTGATSVVTTSAVLSACAVGASSAPQVAHLVSLDGFVPSLWSSSPTANVRMISLASWAFCSTGPPADFAALATALGDAAFGTTSAGSALPSTMPHRPPFAPGAPTATYSGPLLAGTTSLTPATAFPAPQRSRSADDIGYGAAWQLGRLLLLSNRTLFAALVAWIQAGAAALQQSFEAAMLTPALGAVRTGTPRQALRGLMANAVLPRVCAGTFVDADARPAASASEPRRAPLPAAPRHVAVSAAAQAPAPDGDTAPPDALAAWVTAVRQLDVVPFGYLVADSGAAGTTATDPLLPDETIRFFVLDAAWTDQVIAGALSILDTVPSGGAAGSSGAMSAALGAALRATIPADGVCRCGLLLRSQMVADWPELTALAWADDARTTALPVASTRRAPNLLLVVVEGIAQRIDLELPIDGVPATVPSGTTSVTAWAAATGVTSASTLAANLVTAGAGPSVQSFSTAVVATT
jgi:hypothetical protein